MGGGGDNHHCLSEKTLRTITMGYAHPTLKGTSQHGGSLAKVRHRDVHERTPSSASAPSIFFSSPLLVALRSSLLLFASRSSPRSSPRSSCRSSVFAFQMLPSQVDTASDLIYRCFHFRQLRATHKGAPTPSVGRLRESVQVLVHPIAVVPYTPQSRTTIHS